MDDHYADLRERDADRSAAATTGNITAQTDPNIIFGKPAHFMIGQPVEADIGVKNDEWRGVPLWISGIGADFGTGKVVYRTSETWPPHFRTPDLWQEGELIARTVAPAAQGGAA